MLVAIAKVRLKFYLNLVVLRCRLTWLTFDAPWPGSKPQVRSQEAHCAKPGAFSQSKNTLSGWEPTPPASNPKKHSEKEGTVKKIDASTYISYKKQDILPPYQ